MYDGISGLVTQPLEGAKKEGLVGLIKGFGKGIGGVVLKPQAGKESHLWQRSLHQGLLAFVALLRQARGFASFEINRLVSCFADLYSVLWFAGIHIQGDLQRTPKTSWIDCAELHHRSAYRSRF